MADAECNYAAQAVPSGDLLRLVKMCYSSSCWLKLTHLQSRFSALCFLHSCKDALTDRARTLPSEILLAERLARPHPRWSNFSETVWTLSNFIVHLRNTHTRKKRRGRGKIWTDLINCNHMRCKLTFSGQMWLPDIHFLIRYRKLHENDCRPELRRLGLLICTLNQSLNLWWKDLIIWDILILSRLYCLNNIYYIFSLASENKNSVSQKVYGAMVGLYFSSWGLRPF